MTYKHGLFFVLQKNAHKYKIIQKLCFFFFMIYWTPSFLH